MDHVVLINQTKRPVHVRLRNGEGLRLAPGAKSRPVHRPEIEGNRRVENLVQRRVVLVDPPLDAPTALKKKAAASTNTKKKKAGKK